MLRSGKRRGDGGQRAHGIGNRRGQRDDGGLGDGEVKHILFDLLFLTGSAAYLFSAYINHTKGDTAPMIGNLIIGIAMLCVFLAPWPT